MIKSGYSNISESAKINDDLRKFIDKLEDIRIKQGKEEEVEVGKFTASLWWHEPSGNLNWYPILQIDYDDNEIFNHEGTENPNYWNRLILRAIQFLYKKYKLNESVNYDKKKLIDHLKDKPFCYKDEFINKIISILDSSKSKLDITKKLRTELGIDTFEITNEILPYISSKFNESMNESNDEWDPFKGKKYYVAGSISNYPGEISKSSGPVYTDDHKKAIEEWFKINKKFPMETNIMSKTKKDAVALVIYAAKNAEWIKELCNKHKCHYKADHMVDEICKKVEDGCKGFYEGKYGFGDQVYPFCVG